MTLLEYRIKHNLGQADIARLVGRTPGAVSNWETGKRIPRRDEMAAVVQITDGAVTPNDFHGVGQ